MNKEQALKQLEAICTDTVLVKHKDQIRNWTLPEPPNGFTTPVAFHYADGQVELDWTREPERDFASEYEDLDSEIIWPFRDGYRPSNNDWEELGFLPLT